MNRASVPTDPVARLRGVGETLDLPLRMDLFALGAELVPRLIAVLADGEAGWARLHAVDILIDLQATEAITPMLRVMASIKYDDTRGEDGEIDEILDGRIARRLPELGRLALEPALAFVAESLHDRGAVYDTCEVLVRLGIQDERIFDAAQKAFDYDAVLGAGMLSTYGDPRGAQVIEHALANLEPPSSGWDRAAVKDLLLAHRRLGGVLPTDMRERFDAMLAEWRAHPLTLLEELMG